MSRFRLDKERENGAEIRMVAVKGGGPSMSNEANLARLSEIAASGWNEEIATIDGRTVDLRDNEYMIVRVIDGIPRGLPEAAGVTLRQVVADAASQPAGSGDISVGYAGPTEEIDSQPDLRPCSFSPDDLVIGGPEQRRLLVDLLRAAHRRMIVHSTFSTLKGSRRYSIPSVSPVVVALPSIFFGALSATRKPSNETARPLRPLPTSFATILIFGGVSPSTRALPGPTRSSLF